MRDRWRQAYRYSPDLIFFTVAAPHRHVPAVCPPCGGVENPAPHLYCTRPRSYSILCPGPAALSRGRLCWALHGADRVSLLPQSTHLYLFPTRCSHAMLVCAWRTEHAKGHRAKSISVPGDTGCPQPVPTRLCSAWHSEFVARQQS